MLAEGFSGRKLFTKYGWVDAKVGHVGKKKIIILNRHGRGYNIPTNVNYRANITALRNESVDYIISTAAVGSINRKMRPGQFVLLSDFIDFTAGKRETFTQHSFIDLSEPYSPHLNRKISAAARGLRAKTHKKAVYVCTEGPRFETKAEIKMFAKLGADVVGMTQVPEVVLAVEADIPYAAIGVVTNYAAGIKPDRLSPEEVMKMMRKKSGVISKILLKVIKAL
jgi:5'-methylthioadenosine phosphorylase